MVIRVPRKGQTVLSQSPVRTDGRVQPRTNETLPRHCHCGGRQEAQWWQRTNSVLHAAVGAHQNGAIATVSAVLLAVGHVRTATALTGVCVGTKVVPAASDCRIADVCMSF